MDAKGQGVDSELAKVIVFDTVTGKNRTAYKEPNTRHPELPVSSRLPVYSGPRVWSICPSPNQWQEL